MISQRQAAEFEALNAELRAENHALHAELAKTRELLEIAKLMVSQSWTQMHDAQERLRKFEMPPAKPKRGAPRKRDYSDVFRMLTAAIRETKDPTKRGRNRAIRQAASALGYTAKRVEQIIEEAKKDWK